MAWFEGMWRHGFFLLHKLTRSKVRKVKMKRGFFCDFGVASVCGPVWSPIRNLRPLVVAPFAGSTAAWPSWTLVSSQPQWWQEVEAVDLHFKALYSINYFIYMVTEYLLEMFTGLRFSNHSKQSASVPCPSKKGRIWWNFLVHSSIIWILL